jgi:hypothetical protein
MTGLSLKANSK